jgi:SSS family solute:Na+ symporter
MLIYRRMAPSTFHLGGLDAGILIAYVLVLATIGAWAARQTAKTTDDYFLAGRSIPWIITTASFFATCISALTFIGTPAEGYSSDYRYLLSNPGDILATLFIAQFFLPHFQKLRVTSIYEAVGSRFGPAARTTCTLYFLLTRTLASTVRIVAIAKVLEVVTGGALSYAQCVTIVILIILAYTTIGGGRAIAWTDTLQFVLLMSGAVTALTYLVTHVPGGVSGILEAGRHAIKPDGTVYNKFNFLELYKPENLGLMVLMVSWGFFNSSATYGADQDMMQRLLACKDPKKARWSLMVWGLAGIPIVFLFLSIGAALYAYAQTHPELIMGMRDPDHIFPRFILTTMPAGLRGLLLAAIASAAMGSADSALASLATAFTIDIYKPRWGKTQSEASHVQVSKVTFVGFGLLFLVFALFLKNLDHLLWLAFRMIAFTYGPLLGLFGVVILTDWKLSTSKTLSILLTPTVLFFSMAMYAWYATVSGTATPFWAAMHQTYWRLYVIAGTLIVWLAAGLLKEPAE